MIITMAPGVYVLECARRMMTSSWVGTSHTHHRHTHAYTYTHTAVWQAIRAHTPHSTHTQTQREKHTPQKPCTSLSSMLPDSSVASSPGTHTVIPHTHGGDATHRQKSTHTQTHPHTHIHTYIHTAESLYITELYVARQQCC